MLKGVIIWLVAVTSLIAFFMGAFINKEDINYE